MANESCLNENSFTLKLNPFPEIITYKIGQPAIEYFLQYDDLADWSAPCGPRSIVIYQEAVLLPDGLVSLSKVDDGLNDFKLSISTDDSINVKEYELLYNVWYTYYPNLAKVSKTFRLTVEDMSINDQSCVNAQIVGELPEILLIYTIT